MGAVHFVSQYNEALFVTFFSFHACFIKRLTTFPWGGGGIILRTNLS